MLKPPPGRRAAGLVARTLQGAWREAPPAPDVTAAELEIAAPLLVMSGAAPLVWRVVRVAPELAASPAGEALRAQARLAALEDTARVASLERVASLLNAAGVTPLLFKGLVAAEAFAETWLRPSGDFDLMAHPAEIDAARRVLFAHCDRRVSDPAQDQFWLDGGGVMPCKVDLHDRLDPAYAADLPTVFARSRRLPGVSARVLAPSPEDHLRLVIEHFLKHSGWRPLWLCDVAALTEQAGPDFDWRLCLTDDPRRAAWLGATLAAARELLGCRTEGAPSAAGPAPRWFLRAILRQWEHPNPGRFASKRLGLLKAPRQWISARWTGPIRAAFLMGASAPTAAPFAWETAAFARTLVAAGARFASLGFRDRSSAQAER